MVTGTENAITPQEGGASTTTEVASDNGAKVTTPPVKTEPQYLTMEQARQLFREEADKKVSGIQGAKDRQIGKLESVIKKLQEAHGIDDTTVNAAKYEVGGQVDSQFDAQDQQKAEIAAIDEDFRASIAERLEDFDIDPKDKRIDWANELPVSNAKLKKVMTSIGKINKENLKKFKEVAEAKAREDSGVDVIIPGSPAPGENIDKMTPREKIEAGLKKRK